MVGTVRDTVSHLLNKMSLSGKEEESPREPSLEEIDELKQKYEKHGQGQVFAFFDELNSAEKTRLFLQLSSIDPSRINELAGKALHVPQTSKDAEAARLDPLPENATASILHCKETDLHYWYSTGLALIAENKVAVVLMAGGQGTRLGSSAPKGCFDIGLPSGKSLFQIQAERIAKLQSLAQVASGKENIVIPWYIMTSGPTRKPTEEFFEKSDYFGLDKNNVIIFEQGVLPCISNDGKILLESKAKVRDSASASLSI
jgi:UDP-N-acetylglucosamine/UDP-N-acetylgalactosamine diphosphorylase